MSRINRQRFKAGFVFFLFALVGFVFSSAVLAISPDSTSSTTVQLRK